MVGGMSKLPEPILHHILSFLPQDREVVRTSVLSKSWRHLVSTRPNFSLYECYFGKYKEKFLDVLERSLQVYYDRKLCIEKLDVYMSTFIPGLVLLLEKWIPILVVKKFHLSFGYFAYRVNFGLPLTVFESESLQEINLQTCNLSNINSIGNNNHLKTLILRDVRIKDECFTKFLSSCSLIEHLSLNYCKSLRTINMSNHHNLKNFELYNVVGRSIEVYLPSTVRCVIIDQCTNLFHHRNYFPVLTCLKLSGVPLSNEWFNSFSRNFPCLEDLELSNCNGFDELKLSSRSIKNLDIRMDESTTKATIDAPNIIYFRYDANISQCIYINTTTSSEWNSEIYMSLDLIDASKWFRNLSELVTAFSQSQITLWLYHSFDIENPHIEHPADISISCGPYKMPVAMKSLCLNLSGRYYDFFYSDLLIGLFRFVRPREIRQCRKDEFLCGTLQMGRSQEDQGMISFWQQDLVQVSLEVKIGGGFKEWHPVQGTINWSEYVAALHSYYQLRFRLKWRE